MTLPACDCLCAGIIVADHLCAPLERLPDAGELLLTDRLELSIGGCASNVAVDLSRLGVKVGLAGRVGDDVFGRFVAERLTAEGIDCGALTYSETSPTSGTLVINVQGEDRRFVHQVGANAEFTGAEVAAELIRSSRVLYLGGYCLNDSPTADQVASLFRIAREADVTTVLDVVIPGTGNYWPMLEPVLPLTDVFLPNNDEARMITGQSEPREQAEIFREAGAETVVITQGGAGALLMSSAGGLQAGTHAVEMIDGTGSGDAFVAGYIYGLLQGGDLAACLRSGSALGANCVRFTGATTGTLGADELTAWMAEHPLEVTPL